MGPKPRRLHSKAGSMAATTTPRPAKLPRSSHLAGAVQGGRLHLGKGGAIKLGRQGPEGPKGSRADAAGGGAAAEFVMPHVAPSRGTGREIPPFGHGVGCLTPMVVSEA